MKFVATKVVKEEVIRARVDKEFKYRLKKMCKDKKISMSKLIINILDIAIDTIHKLMNNTKFKLHKDAFIHSDQGAHYTSPRFQKLLRSKNLGQSMSRRGNCWDNAPQESFFGHMKDEINYRSCTTFEELKGIIDNYINYYNNYRYQWNLKRLTPVKYRNQLLAA
jgi:putative transposase